MKNLYEKRNSVYAIILNRKDGSILETTISEKDFPLIDAYEGTWCAIWNPKTESFYVGIQVGGRKHKQQLLMHRIITDASKGFVVDHKNHNTLCNENWNLRVVTNAENMQNRKQFNKNNKTGIRGVSLDAATGLWWASVYVAGKKVLHKRFKSIEDATSAVKKARQEYMPFAMEGGAL